MAIPALALLGVQVGSSVAGAALGIGASKDEARALEFQADNEGINATIRGNERLDLLLDQIAASNVAQGASGVSGSSGSALNIFQQAIKKSSKRQAEDNTNTRIKQLSLRSSAFAKRRSAKLAAFGSLLGTGVDIADTGVFSPKSSSDK